MRRAKKVVLVCVLVALAVAAVWLGLTRVKRPAAPGEAAKPGSLMTVTLYFGAKDGSGLVPEGRDLHASEAALENVKRAVEALVGGPAGGSAANSVALLPAAARVRGVYVDGKTAYIDFSRELVDDFAGGSTGEYLLVASIVQTVCGAFPDIGAVAILVNGQEVDTIGGHLNVSRPLQPKDWR